MDVSETPTTASAPKALKAAMIIDATEPHTMEAFVRAKPWVVVGPIILGFALRAMWEFPAGREWFAANDMQMLGAWQGVHHVVFGLLLSFATHGFVCAYQGVLPSSAPKIQARMPYQMICPAAASRSSAMLIADLALIAMPTRPVSGSWLHFWAAAALLAVAWDAYFFLYHYTVHQYPTLYAMFHKTHHKVKDPNCFIAYYVTYQSHFVTEQLVYIVASLTFCPRDVLLFYMYAGKPATYMLHSGFELGGLRVPFTTLTLGAVFQAISFYGVPLGAFSEADHDLHHLNPKVNFALSFRYLDKLFGTYRVSSTKSA